jgi:hypothetical protein
MVAHSQFPKALRADVAVMTNSALRLIDLQGEN